MFPRTNVGYGWHPDLADARDYSFRKLVRKVGKVPAVFSLREQMPPPYDQGDLGSCTGNGIARVLQFDRIKQGLMNWTPSRLQIYYGERQMEGTVGQDSGAQIRDGISYVAKSGACPETMWPYDPAKFTEMPSPAAMAEAKKHPAILYGRVDISKLAIQQCIAGGFPVVFGFTVYEGFESDAVAKTGKVSMPKKGEQIVGGHCVVAAGYDKSGVWCCNSWGTDWGNAGWFHLPWAYILKLADDFWVVKSTS